MNHTDTEEDAAMVKKSKPVEPDPKPEPAGAPGAAATPGTKGFPMPRGGTLVFQHPAAKDFAAWTGPTIKEIVDEKAEHVIQAEAQRYKAITIRPTVPDVALLDELSKLFRQSRNECACALLGAALREALHSLPDHIRARVQMDAFEQLEWGVITPDGQVVLPNSMFDKDGKLIERKPKPRSDAAPASGKSEPESDA